MIKAAFATCLALIAGMPLAQAQTAADPGGVWLRDDGQVRMQIAPCGANICATNLWVGNTDRGGKAGDRLVMSVKQKSADTLAGTAYDERRERTYSITLTFGDSSLLIRGCILGGVLCRSYDWTAIN